MAKRKASRQLPKTAPRRHHEHKTAWILFFLVLLIVAAIVLFNVLQPIHFNHTDNSDSTSDNSSTTTQTEATDSAKESTTEEEKASEELELLDQDKTPSKHEGESANSSPSLTGSISYVDVAPSRLSVRVNIDQLLEDGVCTLHLTQGESDHLFTANIILSASTSTCYGFDVDTANLPSGVYDLRVDLVSDGRNGSINFGEVNL